MNHSEALLREAIRNILLEKKKRGGGITRLGAEKIVNPENAKRRIRTALINRQGDVSSAADQLGVSDRTLYGYVEDNPSFEKLQDRLQDKENDEDDK